MASEPWKGCQRPNANARRGAHHRRKNNCKERGDVKQDEDAANQPRRVKSERQNEDKDDVAANATR